MFKFLVLIFSILQILCYAQNTKFLRNYQYNETNTVSSSSAELINCTDVGHNSAYCDYNGVCLSSGNCKCDDGYITFPDSSTTGCNYKQKSKWVAFLLSFFLGPEGGAGEWYLGNEDLALAQLLFTWVTLIGIGLLACCTEGAAGVLLIPWVLGVIIWWMCDWILIVNNHTHDGNGAPTYDGFN